MRTNPAKSVLVDAGGYAIIGNYTKEAHAGLAQMYIDDPRFTTYYNEKQPGTAEFLRDAICIYKGINK